MEEEEVWEDTFENRKIYGAYGPRDVLMIVASESLVGPDIVHRKRGCLTQQDRDRLISQGIPQECWEDDIKLMEARYLKGRSRFTFSSIEICEQETKYGYILRKIENLMCNTTKPGVTIHYIGPGKRDTGDWCFVDGFITFTDMMALYMDHLRSAGKVLSITSDCSYSGHWATAYRQFFDEVGVQPCAHSARKIGMLLSLQLSCKPNEIGYSFYYSARVQGNDKNTGVLWHKTDHAVETDQHSMQISSARVTCGNTIDEECKLLPDYTYQRQYERKRLYLVRGKDRDRPAWHYILLVDDEETIRIFKEKTQGEHENIGNINLNDYGQVLKSGWGEDPPKDVEDWLQRTYFGKIPRE